MNKPWKLVLLLTGIFLAGALTGGVVSQRIIRKEIARRLAPEHWCPNRLDMLTKRLALTPEQQEKLKPIVQRDMDDLIKVRDNHITDIRRIIERMDRDTAAVLTPEQKVKFDEIIREKRQKAKKLVEKLSGGDVECPIEPAPAEEKTASASAGGGSIGRMN